MHSTALPALFVLLATATWWSVIGGTNLLDDPSFETNPKISWEANGFRPERATAADLVKHGSSSLLVKNRQNANSGPSQTNIQFLKGRHYGFEGYVKLLNDDKNNLWQNLKAVIQVTVSDGSKLSSNIAFRSFCNATQGWIRLKGDIEAPQVDFKDPRLVIRGPAKGVDFVVDNLTLNELPENPHWRQKAEATIERVRKSNILLNVSLPKDVPASEIEIEVSLKSHKFAFGSMLRDEEILKVPTSKVMEMAYSFFQWGLKVRGHSIFWDVDKNIPEPVRYNVSGDQIPSVLYSHLKHVMSTARNLLSQWDVQNEHLAMHFYEEKTHNPDLTKVMYEWARQMNDSGQLYLNEFQCVTSGAQTEQLYDLVQEYLRQAIPLQGIGIQGHTKVSVKPDPTAMWRRIDRLAELGLPIMMTEFDLGWPDRIQRADWFEDSIRAFFGHPAMHGVILWDFWNQTMKYPDKELVRGTGDDLEILESGQRWACLVNKEWTTQKTFQLTDPASPISLRGFQGEYEVLVRRSGDPIQKGHFYLDSQDASWNLDVTSSTAPIPVQRKKDFVPECVSHRDMRNLGSSQASSSSSSAAGLRCTTVKSAWSHPGPTYNVSVSCAPGHVLTGCMSFQKHSLWTRNGEKIQVDSNSGTVSCVAYNGHEGKAVMAEAVCCQGSDLTCDYRTAGPSFPMDEAMAEATCASGQLALGCSSYSRYPSSDGVRPREDLRGCRAQSGGPYFTEPFRKSGELVYTACCQTSKPLKCRVESSSPSELTAGSAVTVACPVDTVLTGCNAFAEDGKAAGARVRGSSKCLATLGANLPSGSTGVRAYAICCSV
ncbi:hypothetical protein ACOMHN_031627 [Nucella lapillus]